MQVSNLSSLSSPLIIPPSSLVCFICLPVSAPAVPLTPPSPPPPPPPLPAGSNSCGRKWRAKVSSHCSICTPACAPVSRLTPAHSSFSTRNYPRRRSVLQSGGRRSKGAVRTQKIGVSPRFLPLVVLRVTCSNMQDHCWYNLRQ